MSSCPRWARALLATCALLATIVLVPGPPAAAQAAGPRSASATPVDSVAAGQYVDVAWTGFATPAQEAIHVLVCPRSPTSASQCSYESGVHLFEPASTGRRLVRLPTEEELAPLRCGTADLCSLAVFDGGADEASIDLADAILLDLSYAPSRTGCPANLDTSLRGVGSAGAGPAFLGWAARLCSGASGFDLDFAPLSSREGRDALLAGIVDFAVSVDPITDEEQALAGTPPRRFGYAPATVSSLVFVHNVEDADTGETITDLKLTPNMLARLFTGQVIGLRGDPAIAALNPDHRLPGFVNTSLRADRSADTKLLTTWLQQQAPEVYASPDTDGRYKVPPSESYPPGEQTALAARPPNLFTGQDAVGRYVISAGQNREAFVRPERTGFIGAVDSSAAARLGLPVVTIRQDVGGTTDDVAPTDEAVLAAVDHLVETPQGTLTADLTPRAGTYPLVKVASIVVPLDGVDAGTEALLKRLVEYVAGDGQATAAGDRTLARGSLALPEALRVRARSAFTAPPPAAPAAPVAGPSRPVPSSPSSFGSAPPFRGSPGSFAPTPSRSLPSTFAPLPAPPIAELEVATPSDEGDEEATPGRSRGGDVDDTPETAAAVVSVAPVPEGATGWVVLGIVGLGLLALVAGPLLAFAGRRAVAPTRRAPTRRAPTRRAPTRRAPRRTA